MKRKDIPEYLIWATMRTRCKNARHHTYPRYGGKGISVCERWDSFDAFLSDMGPRPNGYTLDRIDGAGNYEPSNCRWATRKEQNANRCNVVWVQFRGEKVKLVDAYRLSKSTTPYRLVRLRVYKGWDLERALATPKIEGEELRRRQSDKSSFRKTTEPASAVIGHRTAENASA